MVTSEKEQAATAAHQSYLPVQDAESKSWLEASFWFDLEVFSSRIDSLLCYTQHLINPAALGTECEWDPLFSHLPSNLLRPHCLPVPWLLTALSSYLCSVIPNMPLFLTPFSTLPLSPLPKWCSVQRKRAACCLCEEKTKQFPSDLGQGCQEITVETLESFAWPQSRLG